MADERVSTAVAMQQFDLLVNGQKRTVETYPDTPLLWVLREELELTGTKYGCCEGQCGACTVLANGAPAHSCQALVWSLGGAGEVPMFGLAPAIGNAIYDATGVRLRAIPLARNGVDLKNTQSRASA